MYMYTEESSYMYMYMYMYHHQRWGVGACTEMAACTVDTCTCTGFMPPCGSPLVDEMCEFLDVQWHIPYRAGQLLWDVETFTPPTG